MTPELTPVVTEPCPKCGAPCKPRVRMRGGDHGWSTTDAERTEYTYATPALTGSQMERALVEGIAALLYADATDEPWTVAGIEHPISDREFYRDQATRILKLVADEQTSAELMDGEKSPAQRT